MLHTLFDSPDNNDDYSRRNNSNKFNDIKNRFKVGGPNDNYFGKGNLVIDQYNRKKNEYDRIQENNRQFEKTKNKVKLVVYKNGFILNNGPFRDISDQKNIEFMAEVEKGNIPQELIRKGILDLGILLINRKSEFFRSPNYQSMPLSFESINDLDNKKQPHYQNQDFNQNLINDDDNLNNGIRRCKTRFDAAFVPQTPRENRQQRNNVFLGSNNCNAQDKYREKMKRTNSLPKDKKIIYLNDITRGKNAQKKEFTAFSGAGQLLGSAIIEGVLVETNDIDSMNCSPSISTLTIQLSNGDIISHQFNHNQTVRDIYLYTRQITGSNNFVLFNEYGVPLIDYGRTIAELGIDNMILTQKVN